MGTEDLMPPETIAALVLDLFRRLHGNERINQDSEFGVDLDVDENVRTLYYYAILIEFKSKGYWVHMLTPETCSTASKVQDIIDNIIAEKCE